MQDYALQRKIVNIMVRHKAALAREPMSRERVLEAAIRLADAEGIGAVSMRRLAQELGVEAMTLYYYVANKREILDGIADMVTGEIGLPPPDEHWKASLRVTALSARDVLQGHPWAASLILSSGGGDARARYMNAILGTLRGAGFSAAMTDHAYHAIESHIMGWTLWVSGMNLGTDEELAAKATEFIAQLPRDELPYLVEHIEQHLKPRDPDDEGSFAFGLDLILDGLERRLSG